MKTLIPKTQTEDDLKILRKALMDCAQAIRQAFQIGQETAERNKEDKKDESKHTSNANDSDRG